MQSVLGMHIPTNDPSRVIYNLLLLRLIFCGASDDIRGAFPQGGFPVPASAQEGIAGLTDWMNSVSFTHPLL